MFQVSELKILYFRLVIRILCVLAFCTFLNKGMGQIDTVWHVSDAKNKIPWDLPVDFSIYKSDSTTGEIKYEKWEYGACPWCCEIDFYFKTETGSLLRRNPDVKHGEWMRHTSEGFNRETYRNDSLIEITSQIIMSQIAGREDTVLIPVYNLIQIDKSDSTFLKIKNDVQAQMDSIPIENQACFFGRIFISFIVELDGHTSEVTILKGIHKTFDQFAIETVSQSQFTFCKLHGNHVRTKCVIPITISPK